jgi:hypothetical protein
MQVKGFECATFGVYQYQYKRIDAKWLTWYCFESLMFKLISLNSFELDMVEVTHKFS